MKTDIPEKTEKPKEKPKYNCCQHCGEEVPVDGMTYCGKACAALGRLND